MKNFKQTARLLIHHGKYLINGFAMMMYGVLTAGLIAAAVYGFCSIPSEGGYAAVCDFGVALAALGVALHCMYAIGRGRRKGRYSSDK